MPTLLTTEEKKAIARESGRRLARVLDEVEKAIQPGISTAELDALAEELIRKGGDEPAFLHYQPGGASFPYPASLCTSVNEEVVHGIPSKDRILQEGDIISIDLGVKHKGFITDSARTIPVGQVSSDIKKLLEVTRGALHAGISAVRGGARTGDIGFAIASYVKPHGYSIPRELGGHGVGDRVHEEPYIANFGKKGTGATLRAGQVIALEPMLHIGKRDIEYGNDGYTIRTKDRSLSAHFEHTVLVTENGGEILTR